MLVGSRIGSESKLKMNISFFSRSRNLIKSAIMDNDFMKNLESTQVGTLIRAPLVSLPILVSTLGETLSLVLPVSSLGETPSLVLQVTSPMRNPKSCTTLRLIPALGLT